jgi:hypothetical protein
VACCRLIPVSGCNDLLFLRYGWGHAPGDGSGLTDCFQLVCEVRRRLGLRDYGPQFDWAYETYTEETLPRVRLMRWLLEHCSRVDTPQPGDLLLCQGQAAGAFAVVSAVGGMIHLRESGMVGHQLSVPSLLPLFRPLS